jgi:hypothetical protein
MANSEGQDQDKETKSLASRIADAGWEQFSFVKKEDAANVLAAESFDGEKRLIVISHSCDIVHEGPDFPSIEVLEVEVVQSPDSSLLAFGAPRLIQFESVVIPNATTIIWQARACDRHRVPRERLSCIEPDKAISIRTPRDGNCGKALSAEKIAAWLARQYDRPVLPTEFNNRWAPKRTKIRKSLQRLVDCGVEELLFSIDPDGELGTGDVYDIRILAIMEPGKDAKAANAEVGTLAQHLQCDGIRVVQKLAGQPEMIYWSDVRGMTPFDVFVQLLATKD